MVLILAAILLLLAAPLLWKFVKFLVRLNLWAIGISLPAGLLVHCGVITDARVFLAVTALTGATLIVASRRRRTA
jgi:hypothetical protein